MRESVPAIYDTWLYNFGSHCWPLWEALERTFLGYLRTSLVLSMMGAIVAQLLWVLCLSIYKVWLTIITSRLQHVPTPDPHFGFFIIGKPLAYTCHGGAIIVTLTGAYRSWRVQNAMMRGKAISGGFEIILIGSGVLVVGLLVTWVLPKSKGIRREDAHVTDSCCCRCWSHSSFWY